MVESEARPEGRAAGGPGLPVVLLVVLVVVVSLFPIAGVVLALAVALHGHLAGIGWLRNAALAIFVLALAFLFFSGIGGSVDGELIE